MYDEDERLILAHVEQFGWHCERVDADGDAPPFAYSIGFLHSLGAPECIVFGQPHDILHDMLWEVYRRFAGGGDIPGPGERWPALVGHVEGVIRPVHPSQLPRGHFGRALWHHLHRGGEVGGFMAMQLFWPGIVDGLFPWESGCDPEVRDLQPRLDLPDLVGLA